MKGGWALENTRTDKNFGKQDTEFEVAFVFRSGVFLAVNNPFWGVGDGDIDAARSAARQHATARFVGRAPRERPRLRCEAARGPLTLVVAENVPPQFPLQERVADRQVQHLMSAERRLAQQIFNERLRALTLGIRFLHLR